MWKKDTDEVGRIASSARGEGAAQVRSAPARASRQRPQSTVGRSIVVEGTLSGSENVEISGSVDGSIDLTRHVLTIGSTGRVAADITAKAVVVRGIVRGNVTASEKIELCKDGAIDGNLVSPRVAIAEGSHFRGRIDMTRKSPSTVAVVKRAVETARRAAVAG